MPAAVAARRVPGATHLPDARFPWRIRLASARSAGAPSAPTLSSATATGHRPPGYSTRSVPPGRRVPTPAASVAPGRFRAARTGRKAKPAGRPPHALKTSEPRPETDMEELGLVERFLPKRGRHVEADRADPRFPRD